MNSLLKKQIEEHLKDVDISSENFKQFLEAVNNSYNFSDEKFKMQQRAMMISSEELFEANNKLREESIAQLNVINKLNRVIDTLKFYDLPENLQEKGEVSGIKLVEFIEKQTKEIIEINKQREILLEELEQQNQELNDYAHMVSHDLKAPLRSIDVLSTWLKDDYGESLGDHGKESINLIRNNVEKMDTLISGILEYSTIAKTQITFYNVNLNKILEDVLHILYIPEHITVKINTKLPTLKGDKYRLQQIFQNLIDNAIKNNDKEEGKIEIGALELKTHWQFYIKDNGKGIKKEYFDKIFQAFQKLENDTKSTGLGLSITKKIIELYEGKIWLESTIDKGSTFYFTLKK